MSYIILDIDGTIADDRWREDRIDLRMQGNSRYHIYHMLAGFDKVMNKHLFEMSEFGIIIFTSRPLGYACITKEWLKRNLIRPESVMFRPQADLSNHRDLKKRFLKTVIAEVGVDKIECAYDNRHEVVRMYKDCGVKAEQVNYE